MNWEFVLTMFFACIFVFIIFMTAGFYIGYRKDQFAKQQRGPANPIEGRFFVRHVPESLKLKYKKYMNQ